MNKQRYIAILQNPSLLLKEDIPDLEELIQQFPYCQNAHVLLAKIQNDQGSMHAAKLTRRAALYTCDRQKLKNLLEKKSGTETVKPLAPVQSPVTIFTETKEAVPELPAAIKEEPAGLKPEPVMLPVAEEPVKPILSDVKQTADKNAHSFLDELEKNLKELREMRARAAGLLPPLSEEERKEKGQQIVQPVVRTEEPVTTALTPDVVSEETPVVAIQVKPEEPVLQQPLQKEEPMQPEAHQVPFPETPKTDHIKKNDVLDLILSFDNRVKDYFDISQYPSKTEADISSLENKAPVSEKDGLVIPAFTITDWHLEESRLEETLGPNAENGLLLDYLEYLKEQRNKKQKPDKQREKSIIARFIQKDPSISPLSPSQPRKEEDEEEDEQNGGNPVFISETFAVLLEKQGKIEKAIHVYKELILKSPEKKAYFALKIDELKKKI